jgi:hypothetical protein
MAKRSPQEPDLDSQIWRIQNKINRTNQKVYVYKVADEKFASMTTKLDGRLSSLVGVYLHSLPTYSDEYLEDDIRWANEAI